MIRNFDHGGFELRAAVIALSAVAADAHTLSSEFEEHRARTMISSQIWTKVRIQF